MTARRGGARRGRGGETMVPIGELQDGDRVRFEMPNNAAEWLTLRKVWRYNDGSVVLEFEGREPGMWKYEGENEGDGLLQTVEVKQRAATTRN